MFRKVFGLYIIGIGILLLLSNMDVVDFEVSGEYLWPSLLILIGLSGLLERRGRSIFFLIISVIGVTALLSAMDIVGSDVYGLILWPTIIVILGIRILFVPHWHSLHHLNSRRSESNQKYYTAVFGGVEEKNVDKHFEKCEITAVFGGAKVDFRDTKLKGEKGYIDVVSIFGGCELILPREYRVIFNGTPIFGGMNDKLFENNPDAEKELIINYTVIFGGMDVKN